MGWVKVILIIVGILAVYAVYLYGLDTVIAEPTDSLKSVVGNLFDKFKGVNETSVPTNMGRPTVGCTTNADCNIIPECVGDKCTCQVNTGECWL